MNTKPPLSVSARLAVGALAILGSIGGWYIVLSDGFEHGRKYTRETVLVTGLPAYAMAAIFFLMATIAIAALLQSFKASAMWYVLLCSFALAAPILYLMLSAS